tara:strand:- start:6671 stop:6865 length:195 start_codon:yes stop_codon:yes gene_type:complete
MLTAEENHDYWRASGKISHKYQGRHLNKWENYHQTLKDLSQNSTPKLDSNNNLPGVNFPSKHSE